MDTRSSRGSQLFGMILVAMLGMVLLGLTASWTMRNLRFVRHGQATTATVMQVWSEPDLTSRVPKTRNCLRYRYLDLGEQSHEGVEIWNGSSKDRRNRLRVGEKVPVWFLVDSPDTVYFGEADKDLGSCLFFGGILGTLATSVGLLGLKGQIYPPRPEHFVRVTSFGCWIIRR